MATMTMTASQTGTRTQTETYEPMTFHRVQPQPSDSQQASTAQSTDQSTYQMTNQLDVGVTIQEHTEVNAYLSRTVLAGKTKTGSSKQQTLGQFLKAHSPDDLLGINVLVLEIDEGHRVRKFNTLEALRSYLRYAIPTRRVFVISEKGLNAKVVGLLGYRLGLDPDVFAIHFQQGEVPSELSLPSSVVKRQSLRFEYCRGEGKNISDERLTIGFSRRTGNTWTGVILLNDYHLDVEAVTALDNQLRSSKLNQKPALSEAIVQSILSSIYVDEKGSGSLGAVVYSVFPILVSQYVVMLDKWDTRLDDVAGIRKIRRYIRSMLEFLAHCKMLQARFDPQTEVDVDLIKGDVSFLESRWQAIRRQIKATPSQQDTSVPSKSQASWVGQQSSGSPSQHASHPQHRQGLASGSQASKTRGAHETPPSNPLIENAGGSGDGEDIELGTSGRTSVNDKEYSGTAGAMAPGGTNSAGGPMPPGNPPGDGGYDNFARHIKFKVDQIAYMTNILFSLSLIATIYGMNLDIFTDGGKVRLAKFLVTALPFCFMVFFVTFIVPEIFTRCWGRRVKFGFN